MRSARREVDLGPNHLIFHSVADDTGGQYSLVEWDMAAPPAPGPPRHRHLDADEACYVLDGHLTIEIEGRPERELAAGAYALIPKGSWHVLANPGPGRARFLVILTPPGFEGYWMEQAALMAKRGGPLEAEEVAGLQRKYRMDAGGAVRRFE
jgi:quercetin dioxygenase-like cupin family protein